MFKYLKWFILTLFLVIPLSAFALTGYNSDLVTLSKDKVVNGNYYAAGNTVEIYGTVNGDIFVAGDNIVIESDNINGDIFAAGNNISIKGNINGSLRVIIGQNAELSGEVSRNVMAAGKSFRVGSDSTIKGHLTFFGQMVSMAGQVGRLEGAMDTVSINGTVENDVDVYILSIPEGVPVQLTDDANIGGTLYYQAFSKIDINPNAAVGNISFNEIMKESKKGFDKGDAFGLIVSFFGMLVVGMVLIHLLPKIFSDSYRRAHKHPFIMILKGLLLLIVTPIACFLIAVTIMGLPLALLILGLWVMGLYLGKVMAAWLLGKFMKDKFLAKYKWSPLGVMALGVFFFILLSKIPLIGFFIAFVIYLMAWGTFVKLFKFKKENK